MVVPVLMTSCHWQVHRERDVLKGKLICARCEEITNEKSTRQRYAF